MEHPARRVFAALAPPLELREDLALRLARCPGVHWTPASNMHVTLVFHPACTDVPGLVGRFRSAALGCKPFRILLSGAGAFRSRRGNTLWMAASGASEADEARLRSLRVAVGGLEDAVGHLTLARAQEPTAALAAIAALPAQEWTAHAIGVFESAPGKGPGGKSRYELLAQLPFDRSAHSSPQTEVRRPSPIDACGRGVDL